MFSLLVVCFHCLFGGQEELLVTSTNRLAGFSLVT